VTATVKGSTGSLDDGSYFYYGGVPDAVGRLDFTNPKHGDHDTYTEDDGALADDDGLVDESETFATHVVSGATVKPSGPVFGPVAPPTFTFNLTWQVAGNVVSGTTYPGAHVAVEVHRGPLLDTQFHTADAGGAFSAVFSDVRPGDEVDVVAANPTTHDTTTSTIFAGQLQPKIEGVTDQAAVRGTITPNVTGAGVGRVLWGGDLGALNTGSAPFSWSYDTTTQDDFIYRITARAVNGPSATDYLYVTIDNTAPDGGAGGAQTVPPGVVTTFVTGAEDDTAGLDTTRITFGDGRKASQAGDDASGIFRHVYRRTGVFTATVTITDNAGNVNTSKARIRVTKALSPTVNGKYPTSVRRGKAFSTKLKASAAGTLAVQLVNRTGKIVTRTLLQFSKAGATARLRLPTAKLGRGRYLTVSHFTAQNQWAGPVVTRPLRIR
jgi:PKD domain